MVLKMCLGNLKDFGETKKKGKLLIKIDTVKYTLNTEQKMHLST